MPGISVNLRCCTHRQLSEDVNTVAFAIENTVVREFMLSSMVSYPTFLHTLVRFQKEELLDGTTVFRNKGFLISLLRATVVCGRYLKVLCHMT